MAVRYWLSAEQVAEQFSEVGWALGVVPVYVRREGGGVLYATRNGVPEWLLDLALAGFHGWCALAALFGARGDWRVPVLITGPVPGRAPC